MEHHAPSYRLALSAISNSVQGRIRKSTYFQLLFKLTRTLHGTRIRKPAFFCTALDSIRFVLVCNGFPPRCARACLFQVRLWHAHIQRVKRRPVVALRDPYSVRFVVTFAART